LTPLTTATLNAVRKNSTASNVRIVLVERAILDRGQSISGEPSELKSCRFRLRETFPILPAKTLMPFHHLRMRRKENLACN